MTNTAGMRLPPQEAGLEETLIDTGAWCIGLDPLGRIGFKYVSETH
jgi:hypothetical protein